MELYFWLAPLLSFVAGVLTAFTPCSLANIPLVIFYVGNTGKSNTKKALQLSGLFALGNGIAFIAMGSLAVLFGNLILAYMRYFYLFLGALMVLMALQLWELYDLLAPANLLGKIKMKGAAGALAAGLLGGSFASPCATPVLAAILSILAVKGSFIYGLVLMSFYALGSGCVIVFVGSSLAKTLHLLQQPAYKKGAWYLQILTGVLVLGLGFYLLYLGL